MDPRIFEIKQEGINFVTNLKKMNMSELLLSTNEFIDLFSKRFEAYKPDKLSNKERDVWIYELKKIVDEIRDRTTLMVPKNKYHKPCTIKFKLIDQITNEKINYDNTDDKWYKYKYSNPYGWDALIISDDNPFVKKYWDNQRNGNPFFSGLLNGETLKAQIYDLLKLLTEYTKNDDYELLLNYEMIKYISEALRCQVYMFLSLNKEKEFMIAYVQGSLSKWP